jgi:penicillin-binding protein activator
MKRIIITIAVLLMIISCSSTVAVNRLNGTEAIDLSGNWNATDIDIVCTSLIKQCLASPWELQYKLNNGVNLPTIIVGTIINNSSEHIDTAIIAKKIEVALVNSGSAQMAADYNQRAEVRAEKEDQQYNASIETAAQLASEVGSDYMLQGSVRTNYDYLNGKAVRTYYVSLELVDLTTGLKVWIGEEQIQKFIKQAKYRF